MKKHSGREEAMRLLGQGVAARDVAAKLGVDPTTVRRWEREGGGRDEAKLKAAAFKLIDGGMTPYKAALKLRIATSLVAKWHDERLEARHAMTASDYVVRRGAELLRQGFEPSEVAKTLRVDEAVVRGIDLKKALPAGHAPCNVVGKLPELSVADFVRSGSGVEW